MNLMNYRKARYRDRTTNAVDHKPFENRCLKQKLLQKTAQLAFVVRENNKNRLQLLRSSIIRLKQSKTSYRTRLYREGESSFRRVTIMRYISLRSPALAFIETPDSVFL